MDGWKAWSPLSGTPRPAGLGSAAPAPLMSLAITVYGYTSGDVAISAGHHLGPDGAPVPVAQRRQLVRAAIQALTEQLELLADDPG